jgi:hypothetical protein
MLIVVQEVETQLGKSRCRRKRHVVEGETRKRCYL